MGRETNLFSIGTFVSLRCICFSVTSFKHLIEKPVVLAKISQQCIIRDLDCQNGAPCASFLRNRCPGNCYSRHAHGNNFLYGTSREYCTYKLARKLAQMSVRKIKMEAIMGTNFVVVDLSNIARINYRRSSPCEC